MSYPHCEQCVVGVIPKNEEGVSVPIYAEDGCKPSSKCSLTFLDETVVSRRVTEYTTKRAWNDCPSLVKWEPTVRWDRGREKTKQKSYTVAKLS